MEEYRRGAHAVYDIKYQLIWITKYRYKVLRGRVAERARDLIRQSCQARDVVVVRGGVAGSHAPTGVRAAPVGAVEAGAIPAREIVAAVARRVWGVAEVAFFLDSWPTHWPAVVRCWRFRGNATSPSSSSTR